MPPVNPHSESLSPLLQVLQKQIVPWVQEKGVDNIIVATPSWRKFQQRDAALPDGAYAERQMLKSKRVAVKAKRLRGDSVSLVNARWPQDGLCSTTVPVLCFVVAGFVALPLGDYVVHCLPCQAVLAPAGTPRPDGSLLCLDESRMNNDYCSMLSFMPWAGGVESYSANAEWPHCSRFDAQVVNSAIAGAPGSKLGAEGRNQSFFVRAPQSIPAGQKYFRLKLIDGETTQTFEWPVNITTLTPPSQRPKRTTIGLWDYNYSRATNEIAAKGIAQLFKDSGVSFTQGAKDATYRKALQDQKIMTGGGTHQSYFRSSAYPDYDASGKKLGAGLSYSDPQAIIALPEGAEIPGVKQLVTTAENDDGIATFDYEPNGLEGFSPKSTELFKERYKVSDEDFGKFRDYVVKNGFKTRLTQDKSIAGIWRQWVEFRSDQTSNYVRRIIEGVKAQAPDARIAVTVSRGSGKNSIGTLALGVDNAAMAKFADIIMPQLYRGYSAANAKLVMQMTENWKHELQQQNAKTQLWPLLLIRYSGATVYNSPQRLRQQIIGSLAHGANGIGIYYAGNMDSLYWEMLARTTEDIAKYEDFYQDGTRVDEQFPLNSLPTGTAEVPVFPLYAETVKNPGWAFTAHQLGTKVLLTLINLEEANDLAFGVDIGKAKVLLAQDAKESATNQWLVAPGKIGFIVLEDK